MSFVYIVTHNGGCEGYSEPLTAFDSAALAGLYVEAANRLSGGFEFKRLKVVTADSLKPDPSHNIKE